MISSGEQIDVDAWKINQSTQSHLDFDAARCIDRGLEFLASRQLPRGNFGCYVAKSKGFDNVSMSDQLPGVDVAFSRDHQLLFPALIVGHSLLFLRDRPAAAKMLDKILELVQSCRRQGDLWNHSLPSHTFFKMLPDDLDDTAMALSFLRDMGRVVSAAHPVMMANRDAWGLFHTFVTFRFRWRASIPYWMACARALRYPMHAWMFRRSGMIDPFDVSPSVNANILYHLGIGPDTKPVVKELIRMVNERSELADDGLWYRNRYVVHHFISRNYRKGVTELGEIAPLIVQRMLEDLMPDGSFNGCAQDTAHAICILLDFGIDHPCLHDAAAWLCRAQQSDGSWSRHAYYYGCHFDIIAAWGSEEMTTAICLEAIFRHSTQIWNT